LTFTKNVVASVFYALGPAGNYTLPSLIEHFDAK